MNIRVMFFGRLSDQVSKPNSQLQIESSISARELYERIRLDNNQLEPVPTDSRIKVAINQELADWDSTIQDGDEIAFMPPVTGG